MDIRGDRECTECGTQWSYFETGSVGCPACGSLRSVGTGSRARHTDQAVTLDLTAVRASVDERSTADLAEDARAVCREYVRNRGFVRGGELCELDTTYLAALELQHVAHLLTHSQRLLPDEELYFLSLLRGADLGERPGPEAVPHSLREARGLAVADAVKDYRRDVRQWIDATDRQIPTAVPGLLERLADHETRLRLLDGDVPPEEAESVLEAARHIGNGIYGDDVEIERARECLEAVE